MLLTLFCGAAGCVNHNRWSRQTLTGSRVNLTADWNSSWNPLMFGPRSIPGLPWWIWWHDSEANPTTIRLLLSSGPNWYLMLFFQGLIKSNSIWDNWKSPQNHLQLSHFTHYRLLPVAVFWSFWLLKYGIDQNRAITPTSRVTKCRESKLFCATLNPSLQDWQRLPWRCRRVETYERAAARMNGEFKTVADV